MKLSWRLALLMVLLTLLPALATSMVGRQLLRQSLELGLNDDMDAALEAGVRRTAELYRRDRDALRRVVAAWPLAGVRPDASPDELARALDTSMPQEIGAAAHVTLVAPDGTKRVLQEGTTVEPPSEGAPPVVLTARRELVARWRVDVEVPVEKAWREDAQRTASALQMTRVLRTQQAQVERSFWLLLLGIYGVVLVLGLVAAWWLAHGITRPVTKLVRATDKVAAGDWTIQVVDSAAGELGRLNRGFNDMVRTLDAQSRTLIDLETMAGWREMARALAHEVKNPLTPIQLTVEEMQQRYKGDDAQYRALLEECTRIVVEEVESLRNVVGRFREFSRPVELRLRPLALNDLVRDVAALQRDLRSTTELDAKVGEIFGDGDRLRQVLMNLAENARAILAAQTDRQLLLKTVAHEHAVEVIVADNGPGIPEAERERVFEPYRTGTSGGLGLGMALVKGIVLAHEGSIRVESSTLGGAAIHMTFPRKLNDTSKQAQGGVDSP